MGLSCKAINMNILLIETPCDRLDNDKIDPPIGLLSLATHIKENGFNVKVLDLSSTTSSEWMDLIPENYDVIGFRTVCISYPQTLLLKMIALEKNPKAITVAGGPQASSVPDIVAHDFDYVITGEGEFELLELIRKIDAEINTKKNRVIHASPINPDTIAFPDYSLVNIADYCRIINGQKAIAVLTSRGCGYNCAYCNSSIFGGSTKYRPLNLNSLNRHLSRLISEYGINSFKFVDDNFLGPNHLRRAVDIYENIKNLDISYRCYLRVDQSNYETITLLKKSGCKHITFGIESGDNIVLKSMRRGYTSDQIISGVNIAYDLGLTVRICIMVGFPPFESDNTILNTISLISRLRFHEYFVYPFIPYPKCDVSNNPAKYDIKDIDNDYSKYLQIGKNKASGYVFSTNSYGPSEIKNWQAKIMQHLSATKIWIGDSNT